MSRRGRGHLESVSCSCGHGYCVFCIKTYLDQQKLRESYSQSETECLIGAQLEEGNVQEIREKLQTSNLHFTFERVGLQRSRPASRRVSSQGNRNSQPVGEASAEPLQPDFNSREEFIQYFQDITLESASAHQHLVLSDGYKRVTNIGRSQGYSDFTMRFDFFWQILSVETLAARAYFELEWTGPWIYVAVAYPSMQRHGNFRACGFGGNKNSWALFCRQNSYNFWHDGKSTHVTGQVESSRIGVYLDYEAGVLTFYSVQEPKMTLLYRVQSRFTQPLQFGLWMAVKATAVLIKLK